MMFASSSSKHETVKPGDEIVAVEYVDSGGTFQTAVYSSSASSMDSSTPFAVTYPPGAKTGSDSATARRGARGGAVMRPVLGLLSSGHAVARSSDPTRRGRTAPSDDRQR